MICKEKFDDGMDREFCWMYCCWDRERRCLVFVGIKKSETCWDEEEGRGKGKGDEGTRREELVKLKEGERYLLVFSIDFVQPRPRNHHRQEEGANEEALERGETPQMVVSVVLWLLTLKGEGQGDWRRGEIASIGLVSEKSLRTLEALEEESQKL